MAPVNHLRFNTLRLIRAVTHGDDLKRKKYTLPDAKLPVQSKAL